MSPRGFGIERGVAGIRAGQRLPELEKIGLVCRPDMQNLKNLLTYNAESNML